VSGKKKKKNQHAVKKGVRQFARGMGHRTWTDQKICKKKNKGEKKTREKTKERKRPGPSGKNINHRKIFVQKKEGDSPGTNGLKGKRWGSSSPSKKKETWRVRKLGDLQRQVTTKGVDLVEREGGGIVQLTVLKTGKIWKG